jgi:hypothetical protein
VQQASNLLQQVCIPRHPFHSSALRGCCRGQVVERSASFDRLFNDKLTAAEKALPGAAALISEVESSLVARPTWQPGLAALLGKLYASVLEDRDGSSWLSLSASLGSSSSSASDEPVSQEEFNTFLHLGMRMEVMYREQSNAPVPDKRALAEFLRWREHHHRIVQSEVLSSETYMLQLQRTRERLHEQIANARRRCGLEDDDAGLRLTDAEPESPAEAEEVADPAVLERLREEAMASLREKQLLEELRQRALVSAQRLRAASGATFAASTGTGPSREGFNADSEAQRSETAATSSKGLAHILPTLQPGSSSLAKPHRIAAAPSKLKVPRTSGAESAAGRSAALSSPKGAITKSLTGVRSTLAQRLKSLEIQRMALRQKLGIATPLSPSFRRKSSKQCTPETL